MQCACARWIRRGRPGESSRSGSSGEHEAGEAIGETFAQQSHVLLLRHAPSGIDVDLSVAWLPFELEAIAASDVIEIHGARVRVARPEDLVIYKIAAWRPQDQQDVERLVALHGEHMDLERLRAFARDLATTQEDPRRVQEVEEVLARAMTPSGPEAFRFYTAASRQADA
jgi:Nucleotidyl transferase of unknown function (DUF2204)